ncbi:MAG: ABC transporter substrate-binding protein [Treponema sp.]|nr:ABC transporter substrate-binding protein [Treponema sp.]
MKSNFIKLTGIILCFAFVLTSCSKKQNEQKTVAETRTIVDQVGHTVTLPKEVNRVVIASVWPLASAYCLMFGTDKLVGLDPAIISAAENSMLIKVAPDIVNIESGFSKNGSLNAEELLKLKPDVVLYATGVMEDYDIATQAGIPAVGFSLSVKDFNAVETIFTWIDLLAEVMGTSYDTSAYHEYADKMQKMIAERLSGLTEEEKPAAMIIHRYSDTTLQIPGTSTWGDYWITASGARNVANENKGTPQVTVEEVYRWNPDRIYITNFSDAIPDDLYNNTFQNYDWSNIRAVKERNVYKMPLGIYRWYVTNTDSPLTLLWLAKEHHPDLFADIDVNQEIKDFYKKFYKLNLSDADIQQIYTPKREAAGGIKK